jgi:hypothetical protein
MVSFLAEKQEGAAAGALVCVRHFFFLFFLFFLVLLV